MKKLPAAITVLSVVFIQIIPAAACGIKVAAPTAAAELAALTPDALRDQYAVAASKPLPRDPDLERSGYYKRRDYYNSLTTPMPQRSFTSDEINRALTFLGRPEHEQIGRSRVLSGDEADTPLAPGEARSVTHTRIRSN